jgi:hypothetical protein
MYRQRERCPGPLGATATSCGARTRKTVQLSAALAALSALTVATLASAASVNVNDTGRLHLLKASGSIMLEQGPVTGTLAGTARVILDVGATVKATFSIRTRGGSISGRGAATLHSSGRYASFGGRLSVTGGSGRYVRARGGGHLYGVIDRRTDAVTVQTIGRLYY